MTKFWKVEHGIDNYEELINLNQIDFIRVNWTLPGGADGDWDGVTKIFFRNGTKQEIRLTEKGFEELCQLLISMEGGLTNETKTL